MFIISFFFQVLPYTTSDTLDRSSKRDGTRARLPSGLPGHLEHEPPFTEDAKAEARFSEKDQQPAQPTIRRLSLPQHLRSQ